MTNNKLTYTLIGEGFAEYVFIPAYVNWAVSQKFPGCQVVRTNIQIPISKQSSVSKVLQEAGRFCEQSFADPKNPCDLFIVGIDLDKPDFTDEQTYHTERVNELKKCMKEAYSKYADRIVLFVPIQAVDHWLCYAQQSATANSLEATSKDDIKKKVYGTKNPERRQIEKTARIIAEKTDFAGLIKRSRSFSKFNKEMTTFLNAKNNK